MEEVALHVDRPHGVVEADHQDRAIIGIAWVGLLNNTVRLQRPAVGEHHLQVWRVRRVPWVAVILYPRVIFEILQQLVFLRTGCRRMGPRLVSAASAAV